MASPINYIELIRELGILGITIFLLFRLEKRFGELCDKIEELDDKIAS